MENLPLAITPHLRKLHFKTTVSKLPSELNALTQLRELKCQSPYLRLLNEIIKQSPKLGVITIEGSPADKMPLEVPPHVHLLDLQGVDSAKEAHISLKGANTQALLPERTKRPIILTRQSEDQDTTSI